MEYWYRREGEHNGNEHEQVCVCVCVCTINNGYVDGSYTKIIFTSFELVFLYFFFVSGVVGFEHESSRSAFFLH